MEEYIHAPLIDATARNAYAMAIGLRPGSPMRAIGEVEYENAHIGLPPVSRTVCLAHKALLKVHWAEEV